MHRRHFLTISSLALTAACSPFGSAGQGTPKSVMTRSYDLQGLQFTAKPGLTVSEAESFYPNADIVWRGDPPGPRLAQIKTLFEEAVTRNQPVLAGTTPVDIVVTLERFHGVTDLTRLSVGGVYNIVFYLSVLDARSGAVIEAPRRVVANLSVPGGFTGVNDDNQYQSQRARVADFLTGVLRQELV